MKLKELFDFCVEQGIKQDPRGAAAVQESLRREKEKYEKLSEEEKRDFDAGLLSNPYTDSRILNGRGDEEVSSLIAGIDIETPEVVLADTLRSKGRKIDLILTHHPEGKAYATFYQVIGMQAEIAGKFGVPITTAESLVESRLKEVGRRVIGQNHTRAVDAARLLEFPFMSMHTVADNHVASYLQNLFDTAAPKYVGEILALLKKIPEYKEAANNGAGPALLCGSKDSRAGKVFVDMTGGTEGPKEILEKLADSGVGTIVGMHMSDEHYKNAEKYHLRVVIAGHISSDNLGMNLLLDAVEDRFGDVSVIECSGFRRFKHTKQK